LELNNIFSLFIAVIMIGSIVGFTAFYTFPDQDTGPAGDQSQIPQQPTAFGFYAENVEAEVYQELPSIMIQAETKETNISAVNSEIAGIAGIKRVSGKFEQAPYTILGTGFVYTAEIGFEANFDSDYVLEKLKEETSLENISGSKFSLVELPKIVPMKSIDAELDLSHDYNFSENLAEAIIDLGTIEGDSILVTIRATVIGNETSDLIVIESENFTAAPVTKSVELNAEVALLEQTILFQAGLLYTNIDSISSLEEDANAIEGIANATVFSQNPEASLSITFSEAVDETALTEFESFLNDLNALNVSTAEDRLSTNVSFTAGISSNEFSEKLSSIEAKLSELALDAVLEEATGIVSGEVELETAEAGQVSSKLNALFNSKGLEAEQFQPGKLSLTEIPDPDSEQTFPVENGTVQAFLKPGHSIGEQASVEVTFSLVRGLLDYAEAVEK